MISCIPVKLNYRYFGDFKVLGACLTFMFISFIVLFFKVLESWLPNNIEFSKQAVKFSLL